MESRRLLYIDALRGFAIFGVVVVHVAGAYPTPCHVLNVILANGGRGVQLFFVVSAFTLFHSLAAKTAGAAGLFRFFVRRYFRVAPLYYAGLLIYLVVHRYDSRYWVSGSISATSIALNAMFLNGWHPAWFGGVVPGGWSVSVEMSFYLLLPLLFVLCRNSRQAMMGFCLLQPAYVFLNWFTYHRLHELFRGSQLDAPLSLWLPAQLPVFFCGMILYFADREQWPVWRGLGSAILLCGVIAATRIASKAWFGNEIPTAARAQWAGVAFFTAAFLVARYPLRIVVNHATAYLGRVSYGAYISNFAVLTVYCHLRPGAGANGSYWSGLPALAFVSAGTVIIAAILHHSLELPMQALGAALLRKIPC